MAVSNQQISQQLDQLSSQVLALDQFVRMSLANTAKKENVDVLSAELDNYAVKGTDAVEALSAKIDALRDALGSP